MSRARPQCRKPFPFARSQLQTQSDNERKHIGNCAASPMKQTNRSDGPAHRPEHWKVGVRDAGLAVLDIPADARRERRFEIACQATVRPHASADAPSHELRIYADGDLQWSRRIPTSHPAEFDSLEFRFQRRVGVGRRLRIQAMCDCRQGRPLRIVIEADET